jgi:hypothetical protein
MQLEFFEFLTKETILKKLELYLLKYAHEIYIKDRESGNPPDILNKEKNFLYWCIIDAISDLLELQKKI